MKPCLVVSNNIIWMGMDELGISLKLRKKDLMAFCVIAHVLNICINVTRVKQ